MADEMVRLTNDQIGRQAEVEAERELSTPVRAPFHRPLFRATRLDGKYPTVDFIVDVLGPNDVSRGFFFVQVKGSTGDTRRKKRIPIRVDVDRFNRLVRLSAPTYVIGVDVLTSRTYIAAAVRLRHTELTSITKAYPLADDRVKLTLYREVLSYWAANRPLRLRTGFKDG